MDKQLEIAIDKTLKQIGMPHHISGYRYIKFAIEKCLEDRNILHSITKTLYIDMAREFDTTPSRAERALRYAIGTSWLKGNQKVQANLFGYTIHSNKGRPTNSEFISYMCDFVTLYKEEILSDTYVW